MFKVRFHLKNGKYFMHWQITDTKTSEKQYIDPNKNNLVLKGTKLVNSVKTAQWIKANNLKQVCAWVECEEVVIAPVKPVNGFNQEACYNPMRCDHWHTREDHSVNLDGLQCDYMITTGRKVFY